MEMCIATITLDLTWMICNALHLTLCLPGASQQASKALRELKEHWLIHDPGRRPEAHAVSPPAIHAACHSTCFETESLKLFRFFSGCQQP